MPQTTLRTDWALAQIKPNADRLAERNLLRQGFRVFLPRLASTRRSGARFVTASRPVFPGYVFVGQQAGAARWQAVNATQGITRLVSFGGTPARVPGALIAALRERVAQDTVPPVAPGDKVRLTAGAFADFVATVETLSPERRVWVLLDLLGGATRVAVDAGDLRLI
ncbi:MAG: transcriptional activator RfaH [Rhodobacteraceae bacterium]|nr:transcriptional activator RfaH [Paracoccaceae bacterium]